jgi:RES domain-containing protein
MSFHPEVTAPDAERALSIIEREVLQTGLSRRLEMQLLSLTKGMLLNRRKGYLPTLYRTRKNEGGKHFTKIQELWYPPSEKARAGRLNEQGEPLFYAADTEYIAVLEQRPVAGDSITVLECMPRMQKSTCLLIGELSHQLKSGRTLLTGARAIDIDAMRKKFGSDKVAYSSILDCVFANWMRNANPKYYILTNWISRFVFSMHDLDGVIYPTTLREEGFNIALRPQSADALLTAKRCFVLSVDNPRAFQIDQSPGFYEAASETIYDGLIAWRTTTAVPTC